MIEQPISCSEHPEQLVSGTCQRCGRFVCARCWPSEFPGETFCAPCGAHFAHERRVNARLDLLGIRMVVEPGLHLVAAGFALVIGAFDRPDRAWLGFSYATLEVVAFVTAFSTARNMLRLRREALGDIRRQLLIDAVSIVGAGAVLGVELRPLAGIELAGLVLAVHLLISIWTVQLLESEPARGRFVR